MAEDLQLILLEQSTTIAMIKRVIPNFKKIGKANLTIGKAKKRLEDLDKLWASCQKLNIQLLHLAASEKMRTDKYFTEERFFEAEDAYHEAADYIADIVENLSGASNANSSVSDSSLRDSPGATVLQLPSISLPKFSGNFTEWENFHGLFESLVASKEFLSNTQKLHYLKSSVTGEAAVLINHLKIADTNYEAAWKLLVDEYDNPRAIIQTHLSAFVNLPIMKMESASELKILCDTVAASLAALHSIGRPINQWDDLLVYLISQKFSLRTRNEWNLLLGKSTAYPTYETIREFMTTRIRGLAECSIVKAEPSATKARSSNRTSVNNVILDKCLECSGGHRLMDCDAFKSKSVEMRAQVLKSRKCCFNCFKVGHFPTNCPSKQRCKICRRAHHTLLHRDSTSSVPTVRNHSDANDAVSETVPSVSSAPETKGSDASVSVQTIDSEPKILPRVLLATAWVVLTTREGRKFKVRALLDQDSTVSFITESLSQLMCTKRYRANLQVHCFGERFSGVARSRVSLILESRNGQGPSFPLNAFVYQKITSYAGSRARSLASWPHLRHLTLADPDPFSGHPIQLLIYTGADLYGSLLRKEIKQGPVHTPTAQLTALGWILSGPIDKLNAATGEIDAVNCIDVSDQALDSLIQKFWEVEEVSSASQMSEEDTLCETHFAETHARDAEGRYIVRLPFKTGPPIDIGSSREIAAKLYAQLERRLQKMPELEK